MTVSTFAEVGRFVFERRFAFEVRFVLEVFEFIRGVGRGMDER